jgi:glycosyltransferase involved in cell wall biosynthesis
MKKTLSVCMIVRDEEENIEAVLNDCVGFADEIVVVDTGSKDRTMDIILEQFPLVRLYEFEWCDDFSAARNYSLEKATCDYIVVIDADDRIDKGSIAKINKLKGYMDGKTAFSFIILNLQPDGTHYLYPNQTRCFPNRSDLRYEGWAHNDIDATLKQVGLKEENKKIFIEHLGFADSEVVRKKHERARKILEAELKVKPDDIRIHTYLGTIYETKATELKEAGKIALANHWYKKALTHLEKSIIALEPEFENRPWGLFSALPAACRAAIGLGDRPRGRWYWYKLSVFVQRYPQLASYATELGEDTEIYDELQEAVP